MIQRKLLCEDYASAERAVSQIAEILSGTAHKDALVTFYEKGFTQKQVETLVGMIRNCGFPGLKLAGISVTLNADIMPAGTGMQYNIILTEEADI
ncbi:MAG: hypothetical protein IK096_08030, partial [Lachnospiraceae bacterium]|nr:hypothetical protein [Lachnospiraceae bacterium]